MITRRGRKRGAMRRLAKYMRPYLGFFLTAPLLKIVEVLVELVQPMMMAQVVARGIEGGDTRFIWTQGLWMLLLAFVGAVGGATCSWFAAASSQRFGRDLRQEVFEKVQSFSFAEIDRFSTGSLVTRLTNDVTQVVGTALMMQRVLTRMPVMCVGAMIAIAAIHPSFAAIIVSVVAALLLVTFLMMKRVFPLFTKAQRRLDTVNNDMQENLTGIRVVKSFVRQDFETERFEKNNTGLFDVNIKSGNILAMNVPLVMFFVNMALILFLYLSDGLIRRNAVEIGQMMALAQYVSQIILAMTFAGMLINMLVRASASSKRILEVLDTPSSIVSPSKADPQNQVRRGEIEFRHVSFSYPDAPDEPVLEDISFRLKPGDMLGVLGGTGSGKSSLVCLIPRLYDVTAGQVLVDGTDVREYDLQALREGVGMVLQDAVLFSGTIEENLRWGAPDAAETQILHAARQSRAAGFIEEMPSGYQSQIGQRGAGLSGGQRQRVSIARTLVKDAPILILDDATSAVDTVTEGDIRRALRERGKGATCIIIAQRVSSVMDLDKIMMLEEGRISAIGTHEELLRTCPAYQELCALQLDQPEGGAHNG